MRLRNIIAIAVLALAALTAAAAFVKMDREEAPKRPVEIYIGENRLVVPSGYLRFDHAKTGGRLPEVDLAANAKTFKPAEIKRRFKPDAPDPIASQVFLTLRSADGELSPAERTTRLYARFLQEDHWSHPGGLIMRRFESGSPYEREDLYMAPPEGRIFSARCRRPSQPPDGLPDTCIADIRFDNIDMRMRFSPDLLSEWEHLLKGARGLVQSFRR